MEHDNLLHNILPDEVSKWKYIENVIHGVADLFCFDEIRTSILQDKNLIRKSYFEEEVDDEKFDSMFYSLNDRENICLRPESTTTILKSSIVDMAQKEIQKLFYHGPVFRKHSHSRYKQLHQFGFEIIGHDSPMTTVQLIQIGELIARRLRIPNVSIEISTYGCGDCRKKFVSEVKKYSAEKKLEVCNENICEELPKDSPDFDGLLCHDCMDIYNYTRKALTNLMIDYTENHHISKSLLFFNDVVFNIVTNINGQKRIIGGGGRTDEITEKILGRELPAVVFSINMENLLDVMNESRLFHMEEPEFRVYLCSDCKELDLTLLQTAHELSQYGFHTHLELSYNTDTENRKRAVKRRCSLIVMLEKIKIHEGKVLVINLVKDYEEYLMLSDVLEYAEIARKSISIYE